MMLIQKHSAISDWRNGHAVSANSILRSTTAVPRVILHIKLAIFLVLRTKQCISTKTNNNLESRSCLCMQTPPQEMCQRGPGDAKADAASAGLRSKGAGDKEGAKMTLRDTLALSAWILFDTPYRYKSCFLIQALSSSLHFTIFHFCWHFETSC